VNQRYIKKTRTDRAHHSLTHCECDTTALSTVSTPASAREDHADYVPLGLGCASGQPSVPTERCRRQGGTFETMSVQRESGSGCAVCSSRHTAYVTNGCSEQLESSPRPPRPQLLPRRQRARRCQAAPCPPATPARHRHQSRRASPVVPGGRGCTDRHHPQYHTRSLSGVNIKWGRYQVARESSGERIKWRDNQVARGSSGERIKWRENQVAR
jgi:hypothetical protein